MTPTTPYLKLVLQFQVAPGRESALLLQKPFYALDAFVDRPTTSASLQSTTDLLLDN